MHIHFVGRIAYRRDNGDVNAVFGICQTDYRDAVVGRPLGLILLTKPCQRERKE